MTPVKHATKQQLLQLLEGNEDQYQASVTEHVGNCSECRQELDALAADPVVWSHARRLISVSSMQEVSDATSDVPALEADFIGDSPSVESILDAPRHPEMLGRIGQFDIEREIGRGGMGVVVKAFDVELNRPLAIKLLSPRLAENNQARKRFAREARAVAAVIHPNVVTIHGVYANERTPYLVMPYIAGPSLQSLIDERGSLETTEVVRIAMQVAEGLSAAHAQGIVHRDIKPANILLEEGIDRALVSDFGLARAANNVSCTVSGFMAGTPNYMAPEQVLGVPTDERTDLFSLGSVMYAMCTGRPPFQSESVYGVLRRICDDTPLPIRELNSDIPRWLEAFTQKLLSKSPEQRFGSAAEVAAILRSELAHLQGPTSVAVPDRRWYADETTHSRTPVLGGVGTLCVCCLALICGLLWLFGADDTTQPSNDVDSNSAQPAVAVAPPDLPEQVVVPVEVAVERAVPVTAKVATSDEAVVRTWTVTPPVDGQVNLRLTTVGSKGQQNRQSHKVDQARLAGLSFDGLENGEKLNFTFVGDPGNLVFEGEWDGSAGQGKLTFQRGSEFINALEKIGFSGFNEAQLIVMSLRGATTEGIVKYVEQLKSLGLRLDSTAKLFEAFVLDVNIPFIRDMRAAGFEEVDLSTLQQLRVVGVTRPFVQEWRSAGFERLTAEEAVTLRAVDVKRESVSEFAEAGLKDLSVQQLVGLTCLGVTNDFIRQMEQVGYAKLSAATLEQLKATSVTPQFVKDLRSLGYKSLEVNQLIQLRALGLTPAEIENANTKAGELLGVSELIRRRIFEEKRTAPADKPD